ncbi:MAG: 3-(methylthio)propionyl-CoA ligase [Xanthomonadales bacterium]|nr:3-(methylthio)propionyl-CoA ligase [Xanthomonadales bacterium]
MNGLMMDWNLTISSILRYAEQVYPRVEVVSVTADLPRHRTSYGEIARRSRKLAKALQKLGVVDNDRVATLAWNDHRHVEAYYAVSGMGAICHTVNPRLFADQLIYIFNHAEDQWVFTDVAFIPLLEQLADKLESVKGYIVMTDQAHMPETSLNTLCYESLLEAEDDDYDWPDLDENRASSLCYTSGTTGNPKGVLYSHRSNVIHTMTAAQPNVFGLGSGDCVLPVVPMFHANAWGVPYSTAMVGAKLVMPGPKLADGEILHELMETEKVTMALGVPTVWLALLQYLRDSNKTLTTLKRTVVGGAACPEAIMREFDEKHGVYVHHAWGMTEMSPLGSYNDEVPADGRSEEERWQLRVKQGRPPYGVEMKIVDDDNQPQPWDGKAFGALKVRGPFITSHYFRYDEDAMDQDGWFDTGDVATLDENAYMTITDRTKDVIKSGGEWISSIDLENVAVAHPDVAEAAAIGIAHPKWTERPLLIVVPNPGAELTRDDVLAFMDGKIAKWWMPEDVVFVDELPHTATGKVQKLALREQFKDYQF